MGCIAKPGWPQGVLDEDMCKKTLDGVVGPGGFYWYEVAGGCWNIVGCGWNCRLLHGQNGSNSWELTPLVES